MGNNFSLTGKKILVTGGTGFIGGHLVKNLLDFKANVIVIDIELQPLSTFSLYKLDNKVKLLFVDVRNKDKVAQIFKQYQPEYVFHLAAQATVGFAHELPVEVLETNIMGTVNILEAARKNGKIKGIIAASSDKAYGKTEKAYTEESALRGDHPYDVSKSSMDLICQAYFKTYGLPVVITRFGNVYGEGDLHFERIIPGICKSIIKNETLEIRSNGRYVRDYIYVKDVVRGYLTLLKNINNIYGEAFNFSSLDNLSVLELIRRAEKSLDKKINYKILNLAKNEIPYQHLDDSKIKKLGWVNNYSLVSVLPKIIEWYKNIL